MRGCTSGEPVLAAEQEAVPDVWDGLSFLFVQRIVMERANSVNASYLDTLKRYIANQQRHHAARAFRAEYLSLLDRHKIAYDEKYIWD